MLLAALALVLFTVVRSPLKDDIAWLLYVARRWVAGRELYVDVVEVNPPLIIWISAIPIKLGGWLDLDPQPLAMSLFIAIVLGCAWWAATLLRPIGRVFSDPVPVFAVIGTVLLVVPGPDIGQREHLLIAAFLPYLVLFARTLEGRRTSLLPAILAGVVAGLGCALKPRYACVFAGLEVLALTYRIPPWRVMPVAAGATLAAYAGLVLLTCPAYVQRAVPMALALYGATDVSFVRLLHVSTVLLFGESMAILALCVGWRSIRERSLTLTLTVFALISTVICFIDGKDWFYHRLPATIATILALLCWCDSMLTLDRAPSRRTFIPAMAAAALALLVFTAGAVERLQPTVTMAVEPDHSVVTRLEDLIRKEHAHTYVAFSEWLALGFPVVNNTGVVWASRFDSMWALKGELWRAGFDKNASAEWPIRRWVTHDFITGCPDLAVVDTRQGLNYVAVLSASDPAFARAWTQYHEIASFDGLQVYRRVSGGCINPWIAAEPKIAALDRRPRAK